MYKGVNNFNNSSDFLNKHLQEPDFGFNTNQDYEMNFMEMGLLSLSLLKLMKGL